MKAFSSPMLISAMLVTLTACSAFDTPKKRTATHKAPTANEASTKDAPAGACVSCGAAGAVATDKTSAGEQE